MCMIWMYRLNAKFTIAITNYKNTETSDNGHNHNHNNLRGPSLEISLNLIDEILKFES